MRSLIIPEVSNFLDYRDGQKLELVERISPEQQKYFKVGQHLKVCLKSEGFNQPPIEGVIVGNRLFTKPNGFKLTIERIKSNRA
jgi:hypothetical protein